MKLHNTSQEDIPNSARKAIEEYPRLHASADFNRRVLDAMETRKSQSLMDNTITAFCDRLDHLFENPFLKLFGTALFGMAISWAGYMLVFHLPYEFLFHLVIR